MLDSHTPDRPRARATLLVLLSALVLQLSLLTTNPYVWSNIKNIHRPLHYHGEHIASNFFEGWYFKFVKLNGTASDPSVSMAVIPGIYRPNPDSLDKQGAHAFVVVVGMPGTTRAAYYRFPPQDFVDLGGQGPEQNGQFRFKVGNSIFAHDEVLLDLPAANFEHVPADEMRTYHEETQSQYEKQLQRHSPLSTVSLRGLFPSPSDQEQLDHLEAFAVQGHLRFPGTTQTLLPSSRLMPSIMGITAFVPFLECNHGVASLHHVVKTGHISALHANNTINRTVTMDGGVGYTEKDWGVNFPSTYIWAHTNLFEKSPGSSLLLSVASVPVLGRTFSDWIDANVYPVSSALNARGMLVTYYHAATKTLYNFSTYVISARLQELRVTIDEKQRTQTVSFQAIARDPNARGTVALQVNVTRAIGAGIPLRAPSRVKGRMFTAVEENVYAVTAMRLWRIESGDILVQDVGLGSGLEVVGDVEWLETARR
ncbi:hypothetical protein BGZ70_003639 [Mortierella alpina]|uniref:Uncharacterized protein n=1 Tax=Mortierella alpina TaxID=64518 RepID=A0A9P6LW81_MORAP|nr:hypothetical protein BGZ70_003639 [Mortierella alpina]